MKSIKFLAVSRITVALFSAGCKQLTNDNFADTQKEVYDSLSTPDNIRNERSSKERGWDTLKGYTYVGSFFSTSASIRTW